MVLPAEKLQQVRKLCGDLGRDIELLLDVVIVALKDERVRHLAPPKDELARMRARPDGRALFLAYLEERTGREWTLQEITDLWDSVARAGEKGIRRPIKFEDWLRLYWNSDERCHHCGKEPPEVRLVIDHRQPVKRHGGSGHDNLQFLCVQCNQAKGSKPVEVFRWHKK